MTASRDEANKTALQRLIGCDPVLVGVARAGEVVPGMKPNMILTAGAPLPLSEVTGIHRRGLVVGALYEGLAATAEEAEAKLAAGEILVESTQEHACVGPALGIFTASMPVYVVENRAAGNRAYCTMVEGNPPRLIVNAAWGDDVVERLRFISDVYAPVLGEVVRRSEGGIPLKPIMRRALGMGDELHTRNDAATQLFFGALVPGLLDVAKEREADVRRLVHFFQTTPFLFMRLSIAAAKTAVDAAHGVEGSSLVTGMILSPKEFALRVSGLGDRWFRSGHGEFLGNFFWGSTREDMEWGGESWLMETIGLGGFVQAAAFSLPFRGTVEQTIERNRAMYDITIGENQEFKIPFFENRGAPVGIDVIKVAETGIRPIINGAVLRKDGDGAAGVGPMMPAIDSFRDAAAAYRERYG